MRCTFICCTGQAQPKPKPPSSFVHDNLRDHDIMTLAFSTLTRLEHTSKRYAPFSCVRFCSSARRRVRCVPSIRFDGEMDAKEFPGSCQPYRSGAARRQNFGSACAGGTGGAWSADAAEYLLAAHAARARRRAGRSNRPYDRLRAQHALHASQHSGAFRPDPRRSRRPLDHLSRRCRDDAFADCFPGGRLLRRTPGALQLR